MTQAKGVLPTRAPDREILFKNPAMCGYFVGAQLSPLTGGQLRAWLTQVDVAVTTLTARVPARTDAVGEKVAAVAVGLATRFFDLLNTTGSPEAALASVEMPVGLRPSSTPTAGWFPGIASHPADVLFYVAATHETRVNEFIAAISSPGIVANLTMDRAYQRSDDTEAFGYRDGVRNVDKDRRSEIVFIHTNAGQPDEPAWADGGTYMVSMRIVLHPSAFSALPDDTTRDGIIGRTKPGKRLDLEEPSDPHHETAPWAETVPGNAHVRKAGPRGRHDDTEIFRRGLPFLEVNASGVEVGLQFCSFQANPAQFDTVFNDWMMNQNFPPRADGSIAGVDALLAPGPAGGPLTQIRYAGLYFVPPHHPDGIAGALKPTPTGKPEQPGKPSLARLAITKRVFAPNNRDARFERGGFRFHVLDDTNTVVVGSEFTTASSGRGVCPVALEIGETYTLVEIATPPGIPVSLRSDPFTADKPNIHLDITNQLNSPATGYGGA